MHNGCKVDIKREKDLYHDAIIACNYVHSKNIYSICSAWKRIQHKNEIINYHNWTPIFSQFFSSSSNETLESCLLDVASNRTRKQKLVNLLQVEEREKSIFNGILLPPW